MRTRTATNGEVKISPHSYCNPCRNTRYYTEEVKARIRIVRNASYQLLKLNRKAMEKRRKMQRDNDQRLRKEQQQDWLEIQEEMPSLKHVPQSTSKFAFKVSKSRCFQSPKNNFLSICVSFCSQVPNIVLFFNNI
jgi:DNA-binding transcriptional MerR regulator